MSEDTAIASCVRIKCVPVPVVLADGSYVVAQIPRMGEIEFDSFIVRLRELRPAIVAIPAASDYTI